MAVKDYNTDPDLNTSISGINIAEGCPPSGINDAIRQLMADVKEEAEAQAAKDAEQDAALATTNSNLATLDAAVVHKTGDETIAGDKIFEGGVTTKSFFRINVPNFVQGELPSANRYWHLNLTDANGNLTGRLQKFINKDGSSAFRLCHKSYDGSKEIFLGCGFDKNGNPYGTAPTTPADSTGTQIVTADYAKNTYLAKSGGKMTGLLTLRPDAGGSINSPVDDNYLLFFGGTRYRKGGYIQIFGKDHPTSPGYVYIVPDNGEDLSYTRFAPDGRVTTQKGEVLTSAGGTMSGVMHCGGAAITGDNPTQMGIYSAGSSSDRCYAQFRSNADQNAPSRLVLASTRSGYGTLKLEIDAAWGTAKVNDKNVLVLTEAWTDGNGNWLRKYNDGWIEQGGASNVYSTVTFSTPFRDTKYTILLTKREYGANAWPVCVEKDSQTTTSFKIDAYDLRDYNTAYWYACGY